jgi:hypothetical protein
MGPDGIRWPESEHTRTATNRRKRHKKRIRATQVNQIKTRSAILMADGALRSYLNCFVLFCFVLFCFVLLFCYFVLFCFVILLFCYFVILLFCYFVILLFCYFVVSLQHILSFGTCVWARRVLSRYQKKPVHNPTMPGKKLRTMVRSALNSLSEPVN